MTQVHAPVVEGESWQGTYGGARLHKCDKWEAVTADGTRHPL